MPGERSILLPVGDHPTTGMHGKISSAIWFGLARKTGGTSELRETVYHVVAAGCLAMDSHGKKTSRDAKHSPH